MIAMSTSDPSVSQTPGRVVELARPGVVVSRTVDAMDGK
jgi:hypothetical protein